MNDQYNTKKLLKAVKNIGKLDKNKKLAKTKLLDSGIWRRRFFSVKWAKLINPKDAAHIIESTSQKESRIRREWRGEKEYLCDYNLFSKKAKEILFSKLDSVDSLWLVKKAMEKDTDFKLVSPWKQVVIDKLSRWDAEEAVVAYIMRQPEEEGRRIREKMSRRGPYTTLQEILKGKPNKIDRWMAEGNDAVKKAIRKDNTGVQEIYSLLTGAAERVQEFFALYNDAVVKFTKVIDKACFCEAYLQRAAAYAMLASEDKLEKYHIHYYRKAIRDCNKALEISPGQYTDVLEIANWIEILHMKRRANFPNELDELREAAKNAKRKSEEDAGAFRS